LGSLRSKKEGRFAQKKRVASLKIIQKSDLKIIQGVVERFLNQIFDRF
jgi:hypothetical protein